MDNDLLILIKAAKTGDKEAFGNIYRLFYEPIYRFIYYLVYEPNLAKDLTQETFLKLWKAIPKFKTENGNLKAYLYMIARNLVIDHKRQKSELSLNDDIPITNNKEMVEQLQVKDQNQILYKSLNMLESSEKQILILRYFEELPMAEIALIMNKNESTIRVRVHRLLKKLRQNLKIFRYEH